MTLPVKKFLLFCVLLFGVYLQYQGEQTAKRVLESQELKKEARIQQEHFMTRALELSLAKTTDKDWARGGSVIVKNGEVIGEGWNNNKLLNDPEAHAEVLSIINACRKLNVNNLTGTDIYTSVQPCPRCLSLIGIIGIEKVYYSIPRWKLKQFDCGRSGEYVIELMARSRMDRKVEEIQVLL